jgi:hypothetical protein
MSVGLQGALFFCDDGAKIKIYSDIAIVVKIHGTFELHTRRLRDRDLLSGYSWSNIGSRSEVPSFSCFSCAKGKRPSLVFLNINIFQIGLEEQIIGEFELELALTRDIVPIDK